MIRSGIFYRKSLFCPTSSIGRAEKKNQDLRLWTTESIREFLDEDPR